MTNKSVPVIIPALPGQTALVFRLFRDSDGEVGFTREVRDVVGWRLDDIYAESSICTPILAGFNCVYGALGLRVCVLHNDGKVTAAGREFEDLDLFIDDICSQFDAASDCSTPSTTH